MSVLEIIVIGVTILVITHIILRLIYGDNVSGKYWEERGYKSGYKDGSTNTRMYMGIFNATPTTQWVTHQSGKCLDTREKILEATENLKESYE